MPEQWLNSNKGTKSLTGFFATFYARRTFGNSAVPEIGACLLGRFWGLNTDCILQPFLRKVVLSQNGSPHGFYLSLDAVEQAYQEAA
jgi:hypothetical protein